MGICMGGDPAGWDLVERDMCGWGSGWLGMWLDGDMSGGDLVGLPSD